MFRNGVRFIFPARIEWRKEAKEGNELPTGCPQNVIM
jgi:hypothetical protein